VTDFRTELRPSSFRGIPFLIGDDDANCGRRIVTHEFPGRDDPYHEDLGLMPFGFSLQAFVIGSGYVARATALEAAFLQKGPGTLIHPHYGEVQVVVKDMRRQHSPGALGEVAFSVTFERYTGTGGITVLGDTGRKLSFAAGSMFDLAGGDFLNSLATGLLPAFVAQDGLSRITDFLSFARSIFRFGGLGDLFDMPGFTRLDQGTGDEIVTLFQGIAAKARPEAMPIVGASSGTVSTVAEPVSLVRALVTLANKDVDSTINPNSPSRAAMVNNAAAISTLFKTSALAAAGTAARYAEYESREQALGVRDLMADSLASLRDRQLVEGNIPGWRATTSVMVAVSEDISERIGRLPRTVRVKSNAVRPSLAVANRLYGDDAAAIFSRADDIVKRNRIAHPGFVGVKPLEVLVND